MLKLSIALITQEFPLAVPDEVRGVPVRSSVKYQVQEATVVRPGAELKVTLLLVKREPCDVNLTGALEHSRGNPLYFALVIHDDVRMVGSVKVIVCTAKKYQSYDRCTISSLQYTSCFVYLFYSSLFKYD